MKSKELKIELILWLPRPRFNKKKTSWNRKFIKFIGIGILKNLKIYFNSIQFSLNTWSHSVHVNEFQITSLGTRVGRFRLSSHLILPVYAWGDLHNTHKSHLWSNRLVSSLVRWEISVYILIYFIRGILCHAIFKTLGTMNILGNMNRNLFLWYILWCIDPNLRGL